MLTLKTIHQTGVGNYVPSSGNRNMNESKRFAFAVFISIAFGFFVGKSFPSFAITKLNLQGSFLPNIEANCAKDEVGILNQTSSNSLATRKDHNNSSSQVPDRIWVPSNPRGAERLPPGIVAADSDLYLRRLWGKPSEDLIVKPRYLVTFTVGIKQKKNIDAAVRKKIFLSCCSTTMGTQPSGTSSSGPKELYTWYAKRFMHPNIVAPYDYIFMWDEDLGVDNFDAEEFIKMVRKHGLEISQPGLDQSSRGLTWRMTKRRAGQEVHKETEERPGWCPDPHQPPCAGFVEIMAPVFSREAWRCVWHIIQNDLVHGWGLDFTLRKCVEPAHEKIGVVDSQWIVHKGVPSLGNEGEASQGKAPWQGVRERCRKEWDMFNKRIDAAEKAYYKSIPK